MAVLPQLDMRRILSHSDLMTEPVISASLDAWLRPEQHQPAKDRMMMR
jgi:hypothetical protein